jgi:hypothetical protein
MTDERLKDLLTAALPPAAVNGPARDLWPALAGRCEEPPRWTYLDLALAAAVVTVLALFPESLWLLAYHM